MYEKVRQISSPISNRVCAYLQVHVNRPTTANFNGFPSNLFLGRVVSNVYVWTSCVSPCTWAYGRTLCATVCAQRNCAPRENYSFTALTKIDVSRFQPACPAQLSLSGTLGAVTAEIDAKLAPTFVVLLAGCTRI